MQPRYPTDGIDRFCRVLFFAAIANFLFFALLSVFVMGGNAHNGQVVDGQYFLGNHGVYREVDKVVYDRMWIYENLTVMMHGVGMLAGLVMSLGRRA